MEIVLHGGLGNQIFQWAFGHSTMFSSEKVNFTFYTPKKKSLNHTKNSLCDLLIPCSHGILKNENYYSVRNIQFRNVKAITRTKKKFVKLPDKKFIDYTTRPFDFPIIHTIPNKKSITYYGYFQSAHLIYQVKEIISKELWESLESRKITSLEEELKGANIIHVRSGLSEAENYEQVFGSLSKDYVKRIVAKEKSPVIVVTNNRKYAETFSLGLKIDSIFGPDELDTIQSLGVMARAKKLYCANSTFSWWGGFLCSSRGGEVFIPDPFYKNFSPDPQDSYNFPGFLKLESIFNHDGTKM